MRLNLKWMKAGLAMAIAGCAISVRAADVAAQDPAELSRLVEKQSKQIEMLMQRLDQMEKKQAEDTATVKKVVMETNAALADTNKKVETSDGKLTFGKGIDGLKITGDVRVRAETRGVSIGNGGSPSGDRSRFRERFRVGGVWTNKAESWEIGAGLATGNDRSGRSTNSDLGTNVGDGAKGGAYDHMNIWLDYAYAKHNFNMDGTPASLTLGQQKTPFVTTILNSDSDLRPQGVTFQYGDPLGKEYSGAFLTGGAYVLSYLSDGKTYKSQNNKDYATGFAENVYDLKIQGGYAQKGENGDWLAAAGLESITNAYRNSAAGLFGANSNNPNNPYTGLDTGYQYNILDFYGEYKTTVNGIELKPYGHVAYNLGAGGSKSQQSANYGTNSEKGTSQLGWMLGVDAKKGKWSAGYAYAYIGADCVFGPLRDSDFGETGGMQDTNLQGHIIKVGYDVTKNFNVGGSLMLMSAIDNKANNSKAGNATLIQLDAVYKF